MMDTNNPIDLKDSIGTIVCTRAVTRYTNKRASQINKIKQPQQIGDIRFNTLVRNQT